MADAQLLASLPPISLPLGATITLEAINPTTGAAATGVTVSEVAIYAAAAPLLATVEPGGDLFAFTPGE